MKKLFCVLTVLVLLGSLALPAFAAEADTAAVMVPAQDLMLEFFPALTYSTLNILSTALSGLIILILAITFLWLRSKAIKE